jgi:hypothetical protein
VTEVSVTSGGCRLVRQAAVTLQRAGTISSEYCRLQLPPRLARALLCEDIRSGYTLVGESGYQQPVEFKEDGCFCTGRGFTKFRRATGIPPLSDVLVAVCDTDHGHLHVAMDPAASAQQPDTAMAGAMGDTPIADVSNSFATGPGVHLLSMCTLHHSSAGLTMCSQPLRGSPLLTQLI